MTRRAPTRLAAMAANYGVVIFDNPAPGVEDDVTQREHDPAHEVGRLMVSCNECGESWAPDLKANGDPVRTFRLCPGGCNAKQGAAVRIVMNRAQFTPEQIEAAEDKLATAKRSVRREAQVWQEAEQERSLIQEALTDLDAMLDKALGD